MNLFVFTRNLDIIIVIATSETDARDKIMAEHAYDASDYECAQHDMSRAGVVYLNEE